jgi:hypothetical protein
LTLAFSCKRWNCLPYAGGYLQQPAGLMNRMSTVMNVYEAFSSRTQAKDWAAWAKENPQHEAIIQQIEKMRQNNG